MKVLAFGNPLVKQDSIALDLLPALKEKFPQVEFKEFDVAEDLEREGRDLVILDTAQGIQETVLLTDLNALAEGKPYSMHDFDLNITLKLLKKMRKIDSVKIIAIPQENHKEALEGAVEIISSLLSRSA